MCYECKTFRFLIFDFCKKRKFFYYNLKIKLAKRNNEIFFLHFRRFLSFLFRFSLSGFWKGFLDFPQKRFIFVTPCVYVCYWLILTRPLLNLFLNPKNAEDCLVSKNVFGQSRWQDRLTDYGMVSDGACLCLMRKELSDIASVTRREIWQIMFIFRYGSCAHTNTNT